MKILGVIPARMAATRFPNKPLAKIQGMPMIGHCYFRSKMCSMLDEVIVATCDLEIVEYVESIGGKAIMTSDKHERATERCAEALMNLEKAGSNLKYDIVVMIQGDEPLIDPRMIDEVISPLLDGTRSVSNLMAFLPTQEERLNPNNVKVVSGVNGNALYMSREPLPSIQKYSKEFDSFRQLGLIAFTNKAILNFIELPPSKYEIIESVDMNRFLENEISIFMTLTKFLADSVDTPEDLIRVDDKMKNDFLFKGYKENIL
jgi:3-deoxy-manno-octulosonate cytidylyltransferase (CMP-KDO synthetase)